MKIKNMDTVASPLYDTPPHGDFVRYVNELLAVQAAGIVLHQHTVSPALVRKPQAAGGNTLSAGKSAPVGAVQQAEALVDRIRQLEARRKDGAADAGQVRGAKTGANRAFTLDESKLPKADKFSGWKVLMWGVMALLGVIFPPLGVLLLINAFKNGFTGKAKN